jgi:hypothetical protein
MDEQHRSEAKRIGRDAAVEGLARSQGFESEEVWSLCESVLVEMKRHAAITDFLPIFAVRKVKEILRRRSAAGQEDYP